MGSTPAERTRLDTGMSEAVLLEMSRRCCQELSRRAGCLRSWSWSVSRNALAVQPEAFASLSARSRARWSGQAPHRRHRKYAYDFERHHGGDTNRRCRPYQTKAAMGPARA